jgi:hypothetical protein
MTESWSRGDEAVAIDLEGWEALTGFRDSKSVLARRQEFRERVAADPVRGENVASGILHKTAEILPGMVRGQLEGAMYGVPAAGAAVLAGQLGPQAALPEEIITAPVAFAAGSTAGAVGFWYKQGAGAMYSDLLEQGIKPNIARAVALVAGMPYAGLEFAQVSKLLKAIPGMKKALADKPTRLMFKEALKRFAQTWGQEVAEEVAQEEVAVLAEKVAHELQGTDQADSKGWVDTERLALTAKESAGPLGVLSAFGLGADVTRATRSQQQAIDALAEQSGWDRKTAMDVIQRAQKRKGDFDKALVDEIDEERKLSGVGLVAWALQNRDAAEKLAAIDGPSRRQFKESGLPNRPKGVRARVASELRDVVLPELWEIEDRAAETEEEEPAIEAEVEAEDEQNVQDQQPGREEQVQVEEGEPAPTETQVQVQGVSDEQDAQAPEEAAGGDVQDEVESESALLSDPIPYEPGDSVTFDGKRFTVSRVEEGRGLELADAETGKPVAALAWSEKNRGRLKPVLTEVAAESSADGKWKVGDEVEVYPGRIAKIAGFYDDQGQRARVKAEDGAEWGLGVAGLKRPGEAPKVETKPKAEPKPEMDVIGKTGEWVRHDASGRIGQVVRSWSASVGVRFEDGTEITAPRSELSWAQKPKPKPKNKGKKETSPKPKPEPARTRRFNQGTYHKPVTVVFQSDRDAKAYDASSRFSKAMGGKRRYSDDVTAAVTELSDQGYDLTAFREATKEAARKARSERDEVTIEAPSLEEFKKETNTPDASADEAGANVETEPTDNTPGGRAGVGESSQETESEEQGQQDEPKAEPEERPSKFLRNVSEKKRQRAEELKKRIRDRMKRMSSGVDPTLMADGIELTAIYVEGGIRNFAEYAKEMLDAFGPQAKGYIRAWWAGAADQSEFGDEMEDVTRKQAQEIIEQIEAEGGEQEQPADSLEDRARAIINSDDDAAAKNRAMKALAKDFDLTEKQAQEKVESVLVEVAREIAAETGVPEQTRFDALIALYEKQPRFSKRTSTSIANQAYSTPVPLAFAASVMADVNKSTTLYEPTAGMGALTITADPAHTTVNEIDELRRGELEGKGFGVVTGEDAKTYEPGESVDRVLANPPFGSLDQAVNRDGFIIKKREHLISIKALDAMKDDGRAALILGAGLKKGRISGADKVFLNYLLNNYNVVGNYEIAGELYSGQGAKFPLRLVVVAGRRPSTGLQDLAPSSAERLETWDEVWSKVKEVRDATEKVGQDMGSAGDGGDMDGGSEGSEGSKGTGGRAGASGGNAGKDGKGGKRRPRTGGHSSSGKSTGSRAGSGRGGRSDVGERGDATETDAESGGSRDEAPGMEGEDQDGAEESAADDQGEGSDSSDGSNEPGDLDGGGNLSVPEGEVANDRQRHYNSASKGTALGTLVNKMLSPSIAKALSRLVDKVGDVDKWLAGKLGYSSAKEMHRGLAAEQVDGVALAIDKIENDQAVIIGDQTGIGKGRQASAIMEYAKQRGWMPVFVTADPKLFSDMYGDTQDIGRKSSPLLIGNPGASTIKDKDGRTVVECPSTAKQKAIMQAHMDGDSIRDAGYDSVFLPYSQLASLTRVENGPLGGSYDYNPRQRFLNHLAENDRVLFVLDESHKASGTDSITGVFVRGGKLERTVDKVRIKFDLPGILNARGTKGVTYLSATYAKRPDTMPLYFKTGLGRATSSMGALIRAFKNGGVALQQWAAHALAEAGEMMRREQDFSGVRFDTASTATTSDGRQKAVETIDRISEVLREVVSFSGMASEAIDEQGDSSTANTEQGMQTADFSSTIHNYVAQVLLATKVDAAVAQAINSHKAGEKTVIALSNTMGTFLDDYIAEHGLSEGDAVNLSFGDVLKRALDRTMRASQEDAGGGREVIQFTPEDLGLVDEYEAVMEMINELGDLGADLPASPIDAIHYQLRAAGLKTGELTGRTNTVEYQDDGTAVYRVRPAEERKSKNITVNRFNSGKLDVVILNAAGSTGLSLHASKKFKDKRPRHMVIAQADLNIDTMMQTLGRILRTGMAGPPPKMARYTMLSSPVEAEKRPFAMLSKKMASLNANTTADQDSDVSLDAPDFFNKYGDQVVSEMLAEDIDLATELGITVNMKMDGTPSTLPDAAKKATGKMAILPNQEQANFYEAAVERYNELITELKEAGEYDLEIEVQETWDAQLVSSETIAAGDNPSDPFGGDLKVNTYSIIDPRKPMKPEEVRKALERRWGTSEPAGVKEKVGDELRGHFETLQAAEAEYLGEEPEHPGDDADPKVLAAYNRVVNSRGARKARMEANRTQIATAFNQVYESAGRSVEVTVKQTVEEDGKKVEVEETYTGLITDVKLRAPKDGTNPYRLSMAKVVIAVEQPRRTVTVPLSKVINERVVLYGVDSTFNLDEFGAGTDPNARTVKTILTGNMIQALDTAGKGQITTFRTHSGEAVTGLVMPRGWSMSQSARDPREAVTSGAAAAKLLTDHSGARVTGIDDRVNITRDNYGFRIVVPKSQKSGGKFFRDPGLLRITGDFESVSNMMRVDELSESDLVRAVDYIINDLEVELKGVGVSKQDIATAHGRDLDLEAASRTSLESRPKRDIGGIRQDGTAVKKAKKAVHSTDIVGTIKRLWPGLSVRGRATFRKQAPGWYSEALGEARLRDMGDVVTAVHELGHHFDRQLGKWSRSRGLPTGIAGELMQLGRELYGSKRPKGGYKAEGFAEFIGRYLTGDNIQERAPKLYQWFTTEYLPANRREARKLRKLEDVIARYQIQDAEQAVEAFMSPRREDWSAERVAAAMAGMSDEWIDAALPILRGMQETEADLDSIEAKDHAYMLATFYARSAGGRTRHAALSNTVDLWGRNSGKGLRQALAPVLEQGEEAFWNWKKYLVAKRALERYHAEGKNPGISKEDAQAIVDTYQSKAFDDAVAEFTDFAHRALRPLVESGAMTEAEYRDIVEYNPIYAPMMRQFLKSEKKKGRGKGGKGVHRVSKEGSSLPIHDPVDAVLIQYERLQKVAMQHDVLRALVKFYDKQKGKAESLGRFMSEIPTPQDATRFSAEQIKKQIADKALELGADQDAVEAALSEYWDEKLTVYTNAKEYHGKENVVAIEIDGKRRFFEVKADMLPILEGVAETTFLPDGPFGVGAFVRGATALQRLGATGINPAFGMIRNPLRDTLTALLTAQYHFHVPIFSTLQGALIDILDAAGIIENQYAQMYHGSGMDISTRLGQDMRAARKLGRKLTSGMGRNVATALLTPAGLRDILSHSEVGPRFMEFRGAYKHGMRKWGDSRSAMVLGGCASKDITVNFSRAGTTGRKVNEVVLFANAGLQSIEKLLRALGVLEPLPWSKYKTRGGNALRTLAGAAGGLTVAAVANYLRNRDEEWWKRLPPHEKWGYIHIDMPGDGQPMRIPLPFEAGAAFGALPCAFLEEKRTPGAFKEALLLALDNASPLSLGSWHKLARNIALISPVADVMANKDWKGSSIVPENIKRRRVPAEHYGPRTTKFSKMIGAHLPGGYSPAKIDHLLNGYTGGLYYRLAKAIETATDPSAVGADGDLSTLPVFGTLFLRPGTSRVTTDFYDRLGELRQKAGSDQATAEEIGELAAAERLSRSLQKLWGQRREAITSGKSAGEVKREIEALMQDIHERIEAHEKRTAEQNRFEGIGNVLYGLTSPTVDPDGQKALPDDLDRKQALAALKAEYRRRHKTASTRLRYKDGKWTPFGLRYNRLLKVLKQRGRA